MKDAAYQQVYQKLKSDIDEGIYAVDQLIPTEAELCQMFSVSRTTIRRAIELLARDGYLRAIQGRGTAVLDIKTKQSLNSVTSISETLRNRGMTVRPKSVYIDEINATEKLAAEFGIAVGTRLIRVQRILLADEVPVAIMRNYQIPELVPGFQRFSTDGRSLYMFLEEEYGLIIDRAYDRITARSATFTDAEMLNVPVGTALIAFARVCYMNDRAICVDHLSIVGDRYEFELMLTGRNIVSR